MSRIVNGVHDVRHELGCGRQLAVCNAMLIKLILPLLVIVPIAVPSKSSPSCDKDAAPILALEVLPSTASVLLLDDDLPPLPVACNNLVSQWAGSTGTMSKLRWLEDCLTASCTGSLCDPSSGWASGPDCSCNGF